MAYTLDPDIAAALAILAQTGSVTPPARGDWQALRASGNAGQAYFASITPQFSGIAVTTYSTTSTDGAPIDLRWYTRDGDSPGSAVLYAHGGGMVLGSLDSYDSLLSWYVAVTGVPFLAVDYRLAPEVSGTTLAEDNFAGLSWLLDHAAELGVDPSRIALMGDSGGGAPTAGAAILARDRGIRLARQILIYPMLDDRNLDPDPALERFATWSYDNNFTAWSAVLGDQLGTDSVPPVASPARLIEFADLAPAYIEVGELDIFRHEDIAYAQQLAKAGVSLELHVHPGAPHGYERIAPDSPLAMRAMADRMRVIGSL
jgi:acetyl esterase/lipase